MPEQTGGSSTGQGGATSIKGLFQSMVPDSTGIIQAKVISASPLKMQAVNDDKLTIYANNIVVPWQLTDYHTSVTIEWETEETSGGSGDAAYASHKHQILGRKKIIIHNGLKVGDTVHLLSLNHGKQYYVLDRLQSKP